MGILQDSSEDNQIYHNCFYKGFKHVMSFYNDAPFYGEIDLRSIQEIAAKRLALLQFIDSRSEIKIKSHKTKEFEPLKYDQKTTERLNEIEDKMLEYGFMMPVVLYSKEDLYEHVTVAQTDVVSHFILRLAFCRDRERSEWFIKNECKLFDIRLERLRSVKIQEVDGVDKLETFLANQGVKYDTIKNPNLTGNYTSKEATEFNDMVKFRTDFNTIDKVYLVSIRIQSKSIGAILSRCLSAGEDETSIAKRVSLQQSIRFLSENQSLLESNVFSDERLSGFLKLLPGAYLGNDYSKFNYSDENRLSLSNINQIYKLTFPPCMRRLFSNYLRTHHLKHWGRQQLWLFFKGAGMTLEEHAYNIRHMYGKEGRRANYPPYSCSKIINTLPGNVAGSVHGCPFKELDAKNLYTLLKEFGLQPNQMDPIIDIKNTHQYQLACVEYFNQTTPNGCADGVGTHPNIFFQASFKARFTKEKATEEAENKSETTAAEVAE
ncbi:DNA primase large subunit [Theileria orientalis strain Shintoku]|uniref:DNA primase large subunit n=1 Tax=Theileria orientalis strain Shintoku TaxID=869250 RepID=J4C3W9_THEOR|nr:DNA primase large subunit [Theileria orientalis strain Shintoku]PVC52800.1 DNA primase large subunit [Theileria orientalis]BAM41166.1 DNA primase large subunit [Theileria orientalis strain Shintoku]|eukprot:XP_009691467.1 DNA primase large subunit [Theileria orientalis strain Shintoku]